MTEHGIIYKIFEWGSYALLAVLGWFMRKHIEKTELKEKEQDSKLDLLDKRIDGHDISRADFSAKISSIHQMLQRIDRNLEKLADK